MQSVAQALLSATGRIDEAGTDLDVFRIDVPRDDTDATMRGIGSLDTTARLLDSALEEVTSDDGGDGNFRIETTLDAGTYYLEVGAHEAGPYRVLAWGSDPDCDCAEPVVAAMDHGGTDETSTLMSIGPPQTGDVADASTTQTCSASTSQATPQWCSRRPARPIPRALCGTAPAPCWRRRTPAARGPTSASSRNWRRGRTTSRCRADTAGGYAVSAQLGGDSDHGDTAGLSTLLTFYSNDDVANVAQALLSTAAVIDAAETDLDVFRLDIPNDTTNVTIRSVGPLDTFARLRDASLTELTMDDPTGAGFRIETTLDAGIYYVEVGGHETGRYRVLAYGDSREPCDCAMDGDENDG